MFPIKYIENNLVFNHDGECFAYYELTPYNYSFLSPEEKYMVHDNFRQLIAQNRDGKIHALQIATEDSLRAVQERSKKGITGRLKEIACKKVDEQTEALVEMIGENQIDYRFFLGFKLLVNEEEISFKGMRKSAAMTFADFIYEVNHKLMGDFVSMSNDEINRFLKMEKLLESKISRRFQFRRLDKNDFGYLLEHIYGNTGVAYSDYSYDLPIKKSKRETLVKRYDLIRPTRCMIEENQRYLKIEREDQTTFVAYFTINNIVGELDFPSSEIFYYQQQQFTFPVSTSMNVEIVTNKKALTTVRNKKKELKDLDNHAWESNNETGSNVMDALDSVNELETNLDQSKESMYKLSYVIRVAADTLEELKRRCDEVKDFYDDLNVKLVRPFGDMLGLHGEFIPSSKRYINDYIQYVTSDFLAGLGFGATQQLGETDGIYIGYNLDTGKNVYLKPSLAAHCRSGRYECEYANHTVSYLPEGYFSVTGTQHLPVSFSFPLKKYYGLSLVIDKQSLSEEIKKMMETIPLNLDKIGSTLGIENNGYLSSTPPKLHHLFSELYEALNIEQLGYFKIKAIELLYHIDQLTKNHGCDFKYYDKRQIQATKEIQTYMITHLDERVSLEQLAFRNQINLSLFHKIFLQIYGDTPYSYLKKYKMNIAAHWLLNENMKIGDIAVSLGYNNASKFAIAFQSVYGILPKDYRKQK